MNPSLEMEALESRVRHAERILQRVQRGFEIGIDSVPGSGVQNDIEFYFLHYKAKPIEDDRLQKLSDLVKNNIQVMFPDENIGREAGD